MATKLRNIRHTFDGGWATAYGPTVDVSVDQSNRVRLPFLTDAENVFFELDGGPHKIGGTSKINSSALASGGIIRGVYDFWFQGAAGVPSQRTIVHAGSTVLADNGAATFATILATGQSSAAVPNYSTFDDILIYANDSTTDVPRSWDGTTSRNLAGSPPRFSFSTPHRGRQFAAGDYANPSTLYYSTAYDPENWTGAGSGSILIEPNDGDMITAIASYKSELIIFKGPNKGSIHRLTGSSSSDYALTPYVKSGLGAAWQNSVFQFKDDLGFVSQYGTIHSLLSTAAYGDYNTTSLSLPINTWLQDHLNYNRLRQIWATVHPLNGYVVFNISIDASATHNATVMMDFRRWNGELSSMRWAYWPAYKHASTCLVVDQNGFRRIWAGSNDGFVKRTQVSDRSIDGASSIAAKVTTPYLNYGDPLTLKSIYTSAIGIAPKGAYNGTFLWTRDGNAQQSQTFTQGGNDVLGPSSVSPFTLGTSTLAGAQYIDRYLELQEGGQFRSIQYQITNNGLSEDIEIHGLSSGLSGGAVSTENA